MENKTMSEGALTALLEEVMPLDERAMEKARARVNILTKPQGSLGRLEGLAVQLAGIKGKMHPVASRKRVVVMAADHGVTEEGISAYPSEVTAQMLANFTAGGAAINVLGRLGDVEVEVVDVGVSVDTGLPGVRRARIRSGTANLRRGPAMSRTEALQAIGVGVNCARDAADEGIGVLATGEMGIGNTTASSAVMAALTGYDPSLVVGRGTGLDDQGLRRKQKVVAGALDHHRPEPRDPLGVLSMVGGLEIAALAGLILGAAYRRLPVVIDGFISSTAALVAVSLCPRVHGYLVPSHLSAEAGHALLLDYLELKAYLNMEMRLGEGTGAVLGTYLIEAASRLTLEMATFEDAGISDRAEAETGSEMKGVD